MGKRVETWLLRIATITCKSKGHGGCGHRKLGILAGIGMHYGNLTFIFCQFQHFKEDRQIIYRQYDHHLPANLGMSDSCW